MRPIDADALIAAITEDALNTLYSYNTEILKLLCLEIEESPTIDPVHTAGGCYCRECRYGLDFDGKITCTEWRGMLHKPNDFCSYGNKKGDKK